MHLHDPETGLVAEVTYRSPNGIPVLRSEVALRNGGQATLHLESVSSLAVGCLTPRAPAAIYAADLPWAENDWLAECRWRRQPMRLTTPDHGGRVSYANGRAGFALNGQGAWSSCGRLPMGGLTDRRTGRSWVWQIEHNGGAGAGSAQSTTGRSTRHCSVPPTPTTAGGTPLNPAPPFAPYPPPCPSAPTAAPTPRSPR